MFKKILPYLIITLPLYHSNAQSVNYKQLSHQANANYYEIVELTRAEFDSLEQEGVLSRIQQKEKKQFERWAYTWKDKIGIDGRFPSLKKSKDATKSIVLKSLEKRRFAKSINTNNWQQVGPVAVPAENGYPVYPGKGRVNVIAEDPTDSNVMYIGAATGGVWKTTDNGTTWIPLTDNFAGIGITDILVDPNNTNIIYAATGDEDAQHISSIGLFKSTDAGNTWSVTGLTFDLNEEEFIRDIAFDPGNTNRIFALTNSAVRVSADGGDTFTNSNVTYPGPLYTEFFNTIVFDPNDSSKVVVSDAFGGIYISNDFGANFLIHPVFLGLNSQSLLKLTTTLDDNDHFYGIDQSGELMKFRFNFNNTANDLVSKTRINGYESQGGFNMTIAVSPTNKNNIIVGGVRGYISTNNGASFSVALNPYNDPPGVGFYIHPDHHHFSFLSDGVTVLNGHDGGIHKGIFGGPKNTWIDLSSGLNITQSYNIGITQSANGDDFIMANQDNDGFSKVLKNGTRQWVSAQAGDGTSAGIDFNNPNIRYLGGTSGLLFRTSDGYASRFNSSTQILRAVGEAAFVSPMVVHPVTPTTIYAAHGDLKKSTNGGERFTTLNTGLERIDFVEVATNGSSTRIYVINESGIAKRSDDDGVTWEEVNSPRGQVINSFSAVPNSTTVYASVKAYNEGNKVYKSTNNGNTWTNISSGLPNIIIKEVIYKTDSSNETLYLATELGVYTMSNESTTWKKLGTGLPNVRVDDLKINYTDQDLYAGTYGRGMWKINVEPNSTLSINDVKLINEEQAFFYPNPVVEGFFNINILDDNAAYTIYSVLGGIIKEGTLTNSKKIEVSNFSKGIYLLRISLNGKFISQKLVVD